jgi:S1-C subfamily serine protease
MGKYRIVDWQKDSEQLPPKPLEEWQLISAEYERDLDFAEIAEINQAHLDDNDDVRPEYRQQQRSMPAFFFVFMLLIAFVSFSFGQHLIRVLHAEPQDLSFLADSAILAQDEALRTLGESVVRISGPRANGSGFNLGAEGLIVTNRHVVENNTPVTVTFNDGRRYHVRRWIYVDGYDLALAELNSQDLPHVNITEELPPLGSELIFIGNPLGFNWQIARAELLSVEPGRLILAGPIRSGSSGSPLFNEYGEVIGIIYARLVGVENSGLAVPAAVLLAHLNQEFSIID